MEYWNDGVMKSRFPLHHYSIAPLLHCMFVAEMIYEHLFDVFAFVLGACVGSFLNVCIYRLPLNLSVNQPRRSFCPSCKKQIPWHQNLPLVSWLALRGRCANCGARIAFRYFAIELLTALFFLIIWKAFPWQIAIAYWVFVALVIVATFIDFEHFIIPDEITIGGTIAGLIASTAVPQLMNADRRLMALLISAGSAALGYALLWLVLEGGKLVFGKKRIRLDKLTAFTWARHGDDADFVVGDEKSLWSDFFARENDQLLLHCSSARIAEREFADTILRFHYNRVRVGSENFELDQLDEISGLANEIEIPREAMGRGDLKFLACIGAFLGWRAVLFAIFAGSLYGSIIGLITLVIGKRVWSLKLPFGPYLALGSLTWLFFGESLLGWYRSILVP
jgi:leader peptidase (prepilin peptidase) / N-methyltransferase